MQRLRPARHCSATNRSVLWRLRSQALPLSMLLTHSAQACLEAHSSRGAEQGVPSAPPLRAVPLITCKSGTAEAYTL